MVRIFRPCIARRAIALVATDAVLVFASAYAGLLFAPLGIPEYGPDHLPSVPVALLLAGVVFMMCHVAGLYDSQERYGHRELALRLFLAFFGAYLAIAMLAYLVHLGSLSRTAFGLSFLVSVTASFLMRIIVERLTSDLARSRRVLLLGAGQVSQVIAATIKDSHANYELVGCVNSHADPVHDDAGGVRILGAMEDLGWILKITRPDVIVVAMAERRGALPLSAILECKLQGQMVVDWPNFYAMLTGKILIQNLRPSWLVFSDGFGKSRSTHAIKRGFDTCAALVGCALSLPLLPIIAAAIKLESRGPVFFRQERVGKSGRDFALIKFRTMQENAEHATGPVWASEKDPRITRVGRFLRKSRLDELPQLFNVLVGDMSLVGPRPERPMFVVQLQEQVPFYAYRHVVKPGITGWAQVRYTYGASVTDAWEKLQYDLYYIKNLSVFLDLLVLLHTVQAVLVGRGSR